MTSEVVIRPARTPDVVAVRRLVGLYTEDGRLLAKAPVTLYEDVQEFLVAESGGVVVGCGAPTSGTTSIGSGGAPLALRVCPTQVRPFHQRSSSGSPGSA